ncbi:helix-turn-helix domain-containing protein [Amycolatopsis sp. NPDC051371]|uniref:helix-turn-helix domain-containing protein n=1 Tax=Amycolatopsis sp. NPDC051371 TaxID=3155800 RepID=UPI0034305D76
MPADLVTVAEAATVLGLSERTIRAAIADGTLPAVRIGRKLIKVSVADLAAFVRPVAAAEVELSEEDRAAVAAIVAAAGPLSPEARAELRRLLPPALESRVDGVAC